MSKKTQESGDKDRESMAKTKKERAEELEELNIHGSAEHPIPGTQAWADRNGLK